MVTTIELTLVFEVGEDLEIEKYLKEGKIVFNDEYIDITGIVSAISEDIGVDIDVTELDE